MDSLFHVTPWSRVTYTHPPVAQAAQKLPSVAGTTLCRFSFVGRPPGGGVARKVSRSCVSNVASEPAGPVSRRVGDSVHLRPPSALVQYRCFQPPSARWPSPSTQNISEWVCCRST